MNRKEAIEVINDKLKDLKYYTKEMEEVLKSANYFIDELEKQVKKEPKLKAYHVTDEYSFNYLMKELIEKGYTKTLGGFLTIKTSYYNPIKEKTRNYIYLHDNDSISFSHELVRDGYDIIEYHKEPPRFYAKIKGWELTNDGDCYWYKDENSIAGIYPWSREEASIYTKEEWAELGITDENADFEGVENLNIELSEVEYDTEI